MGLFSPDFDEADEVAKATESTKVAEAVQRREIQYAQFTERWKMARFIELDSGTICEGFIDYLKSREGTFKDIEEIFGIVERLFIDSMTVRFGEAISRGYLKEIPNNIPGILSREENVSFVNPTPLYPAFVEQMRQYYSEFLEWQIIHFIAVRSQLLGWQIIHCMTIRFREAILGKCLKEMPNNIPGILSREEDVIFDEQSPRYSAFVEQMRIYYSQFLELQKS